MDSEGWKGMRLSKKREKDSEIQKYFSNCWGKGKEGGGGGHRGDEW